MDTIWSAIKTILGDYYFIFLMSMVPQQRASGVNIQSRLNATDFETRKLKFQNNQKLAIENKNIAGNLEKRIKSLEETQLLNFENFDSFNADI